MVTPSPENFRGWGYNSESSSWGPKGTVIASTNTATTSSRAWIHGRHVCERQSLVATSRTQDLAQVPVTRVTVTFLTTSVEQTPSYSKWRSAIGEETEILVDQPSLEHNKPAINGDK